MAKRLHVTDEEVAQLYRDTHLTSRQLAARFGLGKTTVTRMLRRVIPADELATLTTDRLRRRPASYGMLGKHHTRERNVKFAAKMRGRFTFYEGPLMVDLRAMNRGRREARLLYPLDGKVCPCGEPATDRHHVDNDPTNNAPENVALLCSSCHISIHARARWAKHRAKIA